MRAPRERRRFLRDVRGQDLVEYALLTAFLGLAGLAALNGVNAALDTWYRTSTSSVNDLAVESIGGGP
jgi:Flp pilus assembly pilin Flp